MRTLNLKTTYLKIILGLFVFFSFQNIVFAENMTIPTEIPDLEEQIDVTVDPKYPQPSDPVTITLDAYGVDLNNSDISWANGGKTLLQGKGERVLKTTAGKAGEIVTISATIAPPNSRQLVKTITITPQSVDILWEAKTYTPPFYKGKAMFSPQEDLKLVAIPNQISSSNAIYKWTQDGVVYADRSGFGVNTFKYTGDIISKPTDFVVDVSDGNGNTAENFMAIAPTDPEVYIYENNPRYGILFNKDLSNLFDLGTNQEGNISIYPFFFGATDRASKNLEYKWMINNATIEVPTDQNDMTFRNTQNVDGKSQIDITVTNTDNFLEEIQKTTLINFQKNSGDGFSF
ncbi:MAG: seg [Candidatus Taylorbacteria bacterium]|nr:seg [Candidatus Taylorbacteria bacterium]